VRTFLFADMPLLPLASLSCATYRHTIVNDVSHAVVPVRPSCTCLCVVLYVSKVSVWKTSPHLLSTIVLCYQSDGNDDTSAARNGRCVAGLLSMVSLCQPCNMQSCISGAAAAEQRLQVPARSAVKDVLLTTS
jgi:hypothetical protein